MSKDKHILASKTLGNLLSEGFSLFGRTYIRIILPFALFYILGILANIILLTPLNAAVSDYYFTNEALIEQYRFWNPYEDPNPFSTGELQIIEIFLNQLYIIGIFERTISGVFTILAICSVSLYLYTTYTKGKSDLFNDFKISFSNSRILFSIFIAFLSSLLYGIAMSGFLSIYGYFLLIPNLLLFCYFIFIVFTYHSKDVNSPVNEARQIARGQALKIFGVFVISYILYEVANAIIGVFLNPILTVEMATYMSWYSNLAGNFFSLFIFHLLFILIPIIFSPLFICLLTPLYVSAKAKKDLGARFEETPRTSWESKIEEAPAKTDKSKKSVELYMGKGKEKAPTKKTTTVKKRKGGLYCPHCGIIIRSATKYCPKCKGKVNFDV